jgi:hypothetical protein
MQIMEIRRWRKQCKEIEEWKRITKKDKTQAGCNTSKRRRKEESTIEKNEMGGYAGFWWGNLRDRYHLGDPGVDLRIILRRIFRKWELGVQTGSIWLRIGKGGGHL